MNKFQKKLVLIAIGFVIVVIGLGAFTRLADAGLGCPDWPGCYGFLHIPVKDHHIEAANQAYPEQPYEFHKAWPEMVHRYFAGTLGLLVLALFVVAFRLRYLPNSTLGLSTGILALIIFQAVLGAWTVTEKLHPLVVMGHLLGGFTTFALLSVLAIRIYQPKHDIIAKHVLNIKPLVTVAIIILVLQIALGGWTSANYAAMICTDLPICYSGWIEQTNVIEAFTLWGHNADTYQYGVLSNEAKVTIHASHRIGAIVTTLVIALLIYRLLKIKSSQSLRKLTFTIKLLLLIQVILGVSNVVFHLPLAVAVAHNVVASLLLISLVSLRTMIWLAVKQQPEISHGH